MKKMKKLEQPLEVGAPIVSEANVPGTILAMRFGRLGEGAEHVWIATVRWHGRYPSTSHYLAKRLRPAEVKMTAPLDDNRTSLKTPAQLDAEIAESLVPRCVVIRTKVYPRPARPGFAWHYVYDVTIPGEPYSFGMETLSQVKSLCKRKAPGLSIHYTWKT